MNASEREKIEEAIDCIHEKNEYHRGMKILCELVGRDVNPLDQKGTVSIDEVVTDS